MKKRIGKALVAVGIITWTVLVIASRKLAQEDLDEEDYDKDDDDDDPYWNEFYDTEIADEFDNEKKDCPHVTMGEVLYHFL